MKLPRQCRICNLLLHYPDYDPESDKFYGKGFCPQVSKILGGTHYEIMVDACDADLAWDQDSERCTILTEKFIYEEFIIQLAHHEKIVYLHKDNRFILCPELLYNEAKDLVYQHCKNKDYMLYKLDTLVNFS